VSAVPVKGLTGSLVNRSGIVSAFDKATRTLKSLKFNMNSILFWVN
jgi:hypothetical protein